MSTGTDVVLGQEVLQDVQGGARDEEANTDRGNGDASDDDACE